MTRSHPSSPAYLLSALYATVRRPPWQRHLRKARREFFGLLRLRDMRSAEREERQLAFLEWFLFDRPLSRGGPPPVVLFARRRPHLPLRQRRQVAGWADSLYSSFEVVHSGEGRLLLRDLHGKEEAVYLVSDRLAANSLQAGDVVTGRLLAWEGTHLFSPAPLERWPTDRVRGLPAMREELRSTRLTPLLRERLRQHLDPPPRSRRGRWQARRRDRQPD